MVEFESDELDELGDIDFDDILVEVNGIVEFDNVDEDDIDVLFVSLVDDLFDVDEEIESVLFLLIVEDEDDKFEISIDDLLEEYGVDVGFIDELDSNDDFINEDMLSKFDDEIN